MMMKQLKITTLLFCALTLAHPAIAKNSHEESLDGIVAIVSDAVITSSELNQGIDSAKKQLQGNNIPEPAAAVLRKQVLDQLINRKLQLQAAEQAGIHIDDTAIDNAIRTIATNNKVTLPELYKKVTEQGMTQSSYRKEIREEMMLQQIQQQEVGSKISVTPQEVNDFMRSKAWQNTSAKEYHLEDILISLPDTPSPQDIAAAKKRANALALKLHQGLSFKSAALTESGSNQALEGGDLGWRKLPEIPTAFADQMSNIKLNDIVGPIQTSNGFHIIHLAGIRDAASQQNAKAKPSQQQVQQLLFQRKFEEALQTWILKLRSETFINTHPEG